MSHQISLYMYKCAFMLQFHAIWPTNTNVHMANPNTVQILHYLLINEYSAQNWGHARVQCQTFNYIIVYQIQL